MAREELGLSPSQLGFPWAAAISSFLAFALGALIPVLPYLVGAGDLAFSLSIASSGVLLLGVGFLIGILTGKSPAWGGLRMLLVGATAAAVTFGVGNLVGVTID